MKTLMSLFPLVKQIWTNRNASDDEMAQPYVGWQLQAFDSYLNIMLSRYMDELIHIPANDLVILVGSVAHEWIKAQRIEAG